MDKKPPASDSKIPYDLYQLQTKLQLLPLYNVANQFTRDEIEVLLECNHHAFYHRSFPYATYLGLGTYYAIQKGYLKPNAKYGAKPKVAVAIILGYILGKISYQSICIEKLLNHPGSQFAKDYKEHLRSRGLMEKINLNYNWFISGFSLAPLKRLTMFNIKNDELTDKTEQVDVQIPLDLSASESKTYEELRKRNREEYRKREQQKSSQSQAERESL